MEDPQVFTLHVISNCPEEDLQCFPSNEGNSFMSRKAVSEGDHSQMLQRSQEDKNLKCFWIWPYPPSFPSRSSPNSASSHPPAGQRRPLPSLLCKAWAGSSLKSLFSGTEGRRALSMEGKSVGLGRPHGMEVEGISLRSGVPGFDSQLCSLLDV